MAAFPKVLVVRGVQIEVNSWEEVDEIVARYGSPQKVSGRPRIPGSAVLAPEDRALLGRFVDAAEGGVTVQEIRKVLGAGRKAGSALKSWGRTIGLERIAGPDVFIVRKRAGGRAHRLSPAGLDAARELLDAQQSAAPDAQADSSKPHE